MNSLTFNPETHEYKLNDKHVPSVTQILQGVGLIDYSHIRPDVLEAARKFGEGVHIACEFWDKGILDIPKLSLPLVPYFGAWQRFCADYKIDFLSSEIEVKVYSKRWGYAGTMDRVTTIKNKLTILEIKSVATMQPATEVQTGGYQIAWEEMTGQKIKQRWGVQLKEDGTYRVEPYKEKSDCSVFLSCLNLFNYKQKRGIK